MCLCFLCQLLLLSSIPRAETGLLPKAGLLRGQPYHKEKKGRDTAGAKRNINLTFSKRVNSFIALQNEVFAF